MNRYHINYTLPTVTLLQESGLGVAEIAARTCYDSFEGSENPEIQNFHEDLEKHKIASSAINDIESSELLDSLAWVHHHHSIIEHATLSFLVQGTSRGVLQEHARHRLQNISVRSTRYTMSSVLNAYVASVIMKGDILGKELFVELLSNLDLLVTDDSDYNEIEFGAIWDKLNYQKLKYSDEEFFKASIAKSSLPMLTDEKYHIGDYDLFYALQNGKKKRNVGDAFKHIVSDNWKVDMVITFNIRSLKNYFDLRDSGAAWFQIKWLAEEMKKATPDKYLRLIDKEYKDK